VLKNRLEIWALLVAIMGLWVSFLVAFYLYIIQNWLNSILFPVVLSAVANAGVSLWFTVKVDQDNIRGTILCHRTMTNQLTDRMEERSMNISLPETKFQEEISIVISAFEIRNKVSKYPPCKIELTSDVNVRCKELREVDPVGQTRDDAVAKFVIPFPYDNVLYILLDREKNENNSMEFCSNFIHEYRHLIDYTDFARDFCNSKYEDLEQHKFFELLFYFSEFRAKRDEFLAIEDMKLCGEDNVLILKIEEWKSKFMESKNYYEAFHCLGRLSAYLLILKNRDQKYSDVDLPLCGEWKNIFETMCGLSAIESFAELEQQYLSLSNYNLTQIF
jgi:hypothetical protein